MEYKMALDKSTKSWYLTMVKTTSQVPLCKDTVTVTQVLVVFILKTNNNYILVILYQFSFFTFPIFIFGIPPTHT